MIHPHPNTLTADQRLDRLRRLEGDLHDAANMAGIATTLVMDLFSNRGVDPHMVGGVSNCHILTPTELDQVIFAVSHAQRLADELKDRILSDLYGQPSAA